MDGASGGNNRGSKESGGNLTKIVLFFGVLQLYNIVSLHQEILNLSYSVQLLAKWWRECIGELFSFLGLEIPPLERDLIALLFVFASAANMEFYQRHRQFLVLAMLGEIIGSIADVVIATTVSPELAEAARRSDYPSILGLLENESDATYIGFGIFTFAMIAIIAWLVYSLLGIGYFIYFVSAPALAVFSGLFMIKYEQAKFTQMLGMFFSIVFSPVCVLVLLLAPIASRFRSILKMSRYLIILLIADLAARFLIDPLLTSIGPLPAPPVQS